MDLIRLEGFSEGRYFFTVNIKETTTSPWNFFLSFFFFFLNLTLIQLGFFHFVNPTLKSERIMLETLNMATWHKIRKRPFLKISFLVFLKLGHISAANPFHVTDLFLDPLKTSENL